MEPGTSDMQVHVAHRYSRHTDDASLSGFAGREPLLVNTEILIGDANKKIFIPAGLRAMSLDNLHPQFLPVLDSVLLLGQLFNSQFRKPGLVWRAGRCSEWPHLLSSDTP